MLGPVSDQLAYWQPGWQLRCVRSDVLRLAPIGSWRETNKGPARMSHLKRRCPAREGGPARQVLRLTARGSAADAHKIPAIPPAGQKTNARQPHLKFDDPILMPLVPGKKRAGRLQPASLEHLNVIRIAGPVEKAALKLRGLWPLRQRSVQHLPWPDSH